MRLRRLGCLALTAWTATAAAAAAQGQQWPLGGGGEVDADADADYHDGPEGAAATVQGIPVPLFASLERYARLVDIAYCVGTAGIGIAPPFSCVSRCREFPELRLVTTWNTGVLLQDSCGYVAVDDAAREVVVAFRGTYSIANTVADLSTLPQEYVPYEPGEGGGGDDDNNNGTRRPTCTNCTVHMGFLASWRSARKVVVPAVAAARQPARANTSISSSSATMTTTPPYRVHLVGHSLGGAVAALAALEMKVALGWADVRVTTFGEPRIGNAGLAAFVDAVFGLHATQTQTPDEAGADGPPYRRVTHKHDPVPLLPLAEWGYCAHSGELYIAKAALPPAPADVRVCRGAADPACSVDGSRRSESGRRSRSSATTPMTTQDWTASGPALWELFFAHRDYFWRLGLCVPGGDPADWGRERYNYTDGRGW
ncbi:extracellular triacylglycerol lipase [Niveomyces insectorum RCEF 264]|uniref:Extracellular triacylglycerol lipase n=1 Tax=Niveomyces insectorum RCEF 264 TaxID=1081102 RepID=A0A162J6I6_9HYPO|nr:extracellular triacylglycerol lipase [Niveomyces insectorum RCEF 264]